MADDRLYAKFTLDFADSHKIAPLSDQAFRQYIEAILWSRRMLTDGLIPGAMAKRLFIHSCLEELMSNDPDNPSIFAVESGYQLHDFVEHQTSKADIEHMREQKRIAGRAGGKAKAAKQQAASRPVADAKQSRSRTPSKTWPETETETSKDNVQPAAARSPYSDQFEQWWKHYPKRESKGDAFKAWEAARKGRTLPPLAEMISAADTYGRKVAGKDPQYVKLAGGWIRDRKWEDEPLTTAEVDSWAGYRG